MAAAKRTASDIAAFVSHVEAFIANVKDDPTLSELFRVAANELHAHLHTDSTETTDAEV